MSVAFILLEKNSWINFGRTVVFLFRLFLYVPVNSYDHAGMDSSPNSTFLGKLD